MNSRACSALATGKSTPTSVSMMMESTALTVNNALLGRPSHNKREKGSENYKIVIKIDRIMKAGAPSTSLSQVSDVDDLEQGQEDEYFSDIELED